MKRVLMILLACLFGAAAAMAGGSSDSPGEGSLAAVGEDITVGLASLGDSLEGRLCFESPRVLEASGPACSAVCESAPYVGCACSDPSTDCAGRCSPPTVAICAGPGCCLCVFSP